MSEVLKQESEKFVKRIEHIQNNPKKLDVDFFELLKDLHINLVERKIGLYEIKIEIISQNKELIVVSTRNWLMMGYKPLKIICDSPYVMYKLIKKGHGLLMSSSPQEMFLQYEAYKSAKGRVLVGGLGLGLYPSMIASKLEVTEVIVVEIDKDIIRLCRPKNKKIKVICDDIWHYLKTTDSSEQFDYIYIDVHYSTGCMEYIHTVLPMRKILSERFPNTPASFWGEEEMKAQYDPDFEKIKGGK